MSDNYDFPNCMHMLSAAMHRNNINPAGMTITPPHDEWWKLWCLLERKFRGLMSYDGRAPFEPTQFEYMGFKFKCAPGQRAGGAKE